VRRVCLVTTGQPSTNPRLVKEADALAEAGFAVHVVGAHWANWADASDAAMMVRRRWTLELIEWRKEQAPGTFHRSRIRHWIARRALATPLAGSVRPEWVLARVGPELRAAAQTVPADLYIAHNLGALPAAIQSARANGAPVGFDAEDLHSGQVPSGSDLAVFTERTERRLQPQCTYVTAASPGIARAYESLCRIARPTCILNVFPLDHRPLQFRPGSIGEPIRLYWFSQTVGPDRGLETAVKAIALLGRPEVELHLRGTPQSGFGDALRQLAVASGVAPERIHLHPPTVADEMTRCAASFDIGLALEPPVSRNNDILLSNKIFTYLLAGCAVIATRTTGQSELLDELGPAARGCAIDDAQSLADALRPWIEDRESLEKSRRAAWILGRDRFNWDREKELFLDVVRAALEDRTSCVA
jgi:glycosyltransferase involved in cell wall biosynthesis